MKKNKILFSIIIILFILIIGVLILNKKETSSKGQLLKTNYKEIKEKTENKDNFTLIVSRSNCSHCISYKPKIQSIAKEYNINIYYIDFDNETEENIEKLFKEFDLDGSTPITLFIKNGKETSILNRLEGDVDKDQVINRLKKLEFIK